MVFSFSIFYTPLFSSLSFYGALDFSLALSFSIWQFLLDFCGLLWAFVGYFLDLRGFVLFVSYFSDGHDLGFHFLFSCRGAQGC